MSGMAKITNVIVPQFPNRAIVVVSQLGKAVMELSDIGPQVFQTVHCKYKKLVEWIKVFDLDYILKRNVLCTCMKDKRENKPSMNHLLL